ncbi:MAG: HAD family hydrolase [Clostridia bacterium]|nr:HAD family hydrolase [Clostridia bacterium]
MKTKINAIIFDLDGTLADTLEDLADSVNAAMAKNNYPTHSIDYVKASVGSGTRELIRKCLPDDIKAEKNSNDTEIIDKVTADYLEIYHNNFLIKTHMYEGLLQVLDYFKELGLIMGVVSNKPYDLTNAIAEKLFPGYFHTVFGMNKSFPRKPDPASTLYVAGLLNVKPENCLFIGDSEVDYKTGVNAKMPVISVTWGFRSAQELKDAGATLLVDKPLDLIKAFDDNFEVNA